MHRNVITRGSKRRRIFLNELCQHWADQKGQMKQHTVPEQVTKAVRATRLPSECQTLIRWLLTWLLWLLLYWETSNQTSHRLADIRIHAKRFLPASSDCPAFGVKFTLPRHKTCECECLAVAEVCIGLAAYLRSIAGSGQAFLTNGYQSGRLTGS